MQNMQPTIDKIFINKTEVSLCSYLKIEEEKFMLIEHAAALLNRSVRRLSTACKDMAIPVIVIEGQLTIDDPSVSKLKMIPIQSFYRKFQEFTIIKREVKPKMKRIGKPTTSGFHHRSTAQRYIKAPNKNVFFDKNLGEMPKRSAYFGILFNLLMYAKANSMIGHKVSFNLDEILLKDYNLNELKNKDKIISNFKDSFETLHSLYYDEIQKELKSKGIEIETLSIQSFLELFMLDLPYNEPYFDKDLIGDQYSPLIEELKIRVMFKEVTLSEINKKKSRNK
jgi:hypothetical protein